MQHAKGIQTEPNERTEKKKKKHCTEHGITKILFHTHTYSYTRTTYSPEQFLRW